MKKGKKALILPKGFDLDKSYALQALMDGVANADQQKKALKYIVEDLAGTYDDPADFESGNASFYNMGRASVGRSIVSICKMKLDKVKSIL